MPQRGGSHHRTATAPHEIPITRNDDCGVESPVRALFDAGYLYEIAGLVYYLVFLAMTRKGTVSRYSQLTRILTMGTAIALVLVGLLHSASNPIVIGAIIALAIGSLVSSLVDQRKLQR